MRTTILILSFLNGGFMLADGIHVLVKGKYIGPPEPGPWAELFHALNVNVFKLGPLFILFGLLWLLFLAGYRGRQKWGRPLGFFLSVATLWYLPVGTLFSVIVFLLLLRSK